MLQNVKNQNLMRNSSKTSAAYQAMQVQWKLLAKGSAKKLEKQHKTPTNIM